MDTAYFIKQLIHQLYKKFVHQPQNIYDVMEKKRKTRIEIR